MAPPIVVLTGQLAAGKSTLARAVARRYERGVHIDIDGVRELVVSGLASPLEWTEETTRQFRLAIEGSLALGRIYQRAGFAVVLDGAVDPTDVEAAAIALDLSDRVVGIVLHPPLQVALERNRARTHKGFDTSLLEPVIQLLDEDLRSQAAPSGWHVLDNGRESVETTVDRILALLPDDDGRYPASRRAASGPPDPASPASSGAAQD